MDCYRVATASGTDSTIVVDLISSHASLVMSPKLSHHSVSRQQALYRRICERGSRGTAHS